MGGGGAGVVGGDGRGGRGGWGGAGASFNYQHACPPPHLCAAHTRAQAAYDAYRSLFSGKIVMGVEVPPEVRAQGGGG